MSFSAARSADVAMLFLAFAFMVSPAFLARAIADAASTRQDSMKFCMDDMEEEREEGIKSGGRALAKTTYTFLNMFKHDISHETE